MGGQRRIITPKSLGSAFLLSRRAGIDAALVKTDFFFAGAPPIENKIAQKIQTLRWRLAKVAFDTVQLWYKPSGHQRPATRTLDYTLRAESGCLILEDVEGVTG